MKGKVVVLIPLVIVIVGVFVAYRINVKEANRKDLPIIQPNDVKPEMVDSKLRNIGIGHRIKDFNFLDQNGDKVTLDNVKGSVFVAEYFFTTCKTICPIMNDQMIRVQKRFKGNPKLKILSFTVDPEIDSVSVMKAYAEEHNAVDNQWYFLTGNKDSLYHLARNSFFVLKPAEAKNVGDAGSDFIHTNNFVLVDQELRIRGYYDGTSKEEVGTLMDDIDLLLKDEK